MAQPVSSGTADFGYTNMVKGVLGDSQFALLVWLDRGSGEC